MSRHNFLFSKDYVSVYLLVDFAVYETFPFHSVSVESYEFSGDQFVAFAQPDSGFCTLYVWDHVEMVFRRFHNITCKRQSKQALRSNNAMIISLCSFYFCVCFLQLALLCIANQW